MSNDTKSPRGRKPNADAEVIDVKVNETALSEANHALVALAPRDRAVLERFNDGLPYDRVRLVDEAAFFLAQAADAMLEIGRRLIVLKEMETKGTFHEIIEGRLGLGIRSAQLFMQASAKFLSPQLRGHAQQASRLGKTKLFALMHEDPEVIEAFMEGGTVAGLVFDDVETMSVREFKAALAEAHKQAKAKDRVIKAQSDKINEQAEQLHLLESRDPDEREQAQLELLRERVQHADIAIASAIKAALDVINDPANGRTELVAQQSAQLLMRRIVDYCLANGFPVDLAAEVDPIWTMSRSGQ